MSELQDESSIQPAGDQEYYEETVVEYVDNRRRRAILAAVLVVLVILLAGLGYLAAKLSRPASAPTSTELPPGIEWVRSIYAWGPTVKEAVISPTAAGVSADGTIWALAQKRYIVAFSPTGQVRRVIAPVQGSAIGQVQYLEGIAVGDDGSLYVADYGNNIILVYSPAGQLLRYWQMQLPMAIDVKGDRVAVAGAFGIAVFDTQGKLISKWGGRGPGKDQFDLPHGIVIGADNNIYVSDTQNRRVKAYSQSGKLLWMMTDPRKTSSSLGSTNAKVATINGVDQGLLLPAGITQDSAGRLVLVDPFSFEMVVMDPKRQGQIVARYGKEGQLDGQFAYPTGIAYDPGHDWFVVADTTNNRLQIIRLPGTGGNAVTRAVKSLTDTPVWICCIPWILLLVAAFLLVTARRRKKAEEETTEDQELPAA